MKTIHWILGLALIASVPAIAQDDIVPATSEDVQEFDDSVSEVTETTTTDTTSQTEGQQESFGNSVSAEARKLKDMSKEDRKNMGKWVSDQRRKDSDKRAAIGGANGAGAGIGAGSTMGASGDARSSAPSLNDAGKPSSPGQVSGKPSNRPR